MKQFHIVKSHKLFYDICESNIHFLNKDQYDSLVILYQKQPSDLLFLIIKLFSMLTFYT